MFNRFIGRHQIIESRRRPSGTKVTKPPSSIEFPVKHVQNYEVLRPNIVHELKTIVGNEHVLTEEADLIAYSIDGTWIESRPLAVVLPINAQEVSAILRLANRELLVVAPRGSASGLSGGSLPFGGGIALSMMRLYKLRLRKRVSSIHPIHQACIYQLLVAILQRMLVEHAV